MYVNISKLPNTSYQPFDNWLTLWWVLWPAHTLGDNSSIETPMKSVQCSWDKARSAHTLGDNEYYMYLMVILIQ